MRHRTAERVSRQTEALVISVSQRREVINLYLRGRRLTLEDTEVLLAKANQALQTLQNYRTRLGEVLDRLTHLEFDDLVTLGDVAEVVGALRDGASGRPTRWFATSASSGPRGASSGCSPTS